MPRYRKLPVEVEAIQWFKNGDHPEDNPTRGGTTPAGEYWEGEVVRYFRRPGMPSDEICKKCGHFMEKHGWIDTFEGGHVVCPGDFIITGIQGERYPCKPDIFEATYGPVEEINTESPHGAGGVNMNCDKCGRFHDHGPGSAWKMVYSGGPIRMPDREITRCRACVEKHGPFFPQSGIKDEYSCGIIEADK